MMHITFIVGSYQPQQCGVADYTAHLREQLTRLNVTSTVLTTTHSAAQAVADSNIIGAVPNWNVLSLAPLIRIILSTKTDILHIQHAAGSYNFQRSLFLLPRLLRSLGYKTPIVTTAHEYGWWEWQPKWIPASLLERLKEWGQKRYWWDREDGFLLTDSDAVITTNDNIARIIRDRLPGLQHRVASIPIAANIEVVHMNRAQARHQLRQQCGWSDDAQVIAFFGFLHPVKGIETLLHATRLVIDQYPQVRLLLIGGVETLALQGVAATDYWNQLGQTISDLKLDDKVHRTGYISSDTASQYLSAADIGVLPFNPGVTLKSGSLLALLAHQLPTVITTSEETDDVLWGEAVRRVPPRNANALADALMALTQHKADRDRLSLAGHQLVQSFSWPAIAQQHVDLYQSV